MELVLTFAIVYLIEAIIAWQYFSKIFSAKTSKIVECLVIVLGYCILFGVYFISEYWINIVLFFIINLVIILLLYEANFLSAVFQSVIVTSLMGFTELLTSNILGSLFPDYSVTSKELSTVSIYAILSKLLYYIVLQVITRFYYKGEIKKKDKSVIMLTVVPTISVLVMVTLFGISAYYSLSYIFDLLIAACSIAMLLVNIIVFWIYYYSQKKNNEFFELQLQLQKEEAISEYNKMLMKQDENQKILIHDIKNHLNAIAILNDSGAAKKVREYIDKLVNSSTLNNSVNICENKLLNSILNRYMRQCKEKNIRLYMDIRSMDLDFISDEDITSLFCNLLDNAIEAAEKKNNSYIDLKIVNKADDMIIINLINHCEYKPVYDKENKLITGKMHKSRHGFGLKSIEKATEKYGGGMKSYYNDEEQAFHTIVMLKNKSV